jgi:hypothetical protein
MKSLKNNSYFVDCACTSDDHVVRFRFDSDSKETYISTQLGKFGFFKRVWFAIEYIFGKQCAYGHWQETLLQEEEFVDLYNTMTAYAIKAGIKNPSAKKIKEALDAVSNGETNSVVRSGLHSEKDRDVLNKPEHQKS